MASLRPIPFWQALLIFGVPGVLMWAGVHLLVPIGVASGVPLIYAWTLCVLVPTIGNAIVILSIYYARERPDWAAFVSRFRLHKPTKKQLWLIPVLALGILALNEAFAWTIPLLQNVPGFGLPSVVPEIFVNPYEAIAPGRGERTFLGVPLNPDNRWLLAFWLLYVVGGVFGEELVWRGYVLPRQEATYGAKAWLVNGMLWNVPFHLYTLSHFFSDLPFYLILPFVVQRIGNTWIAISVHALLASLAYILIVPGVWG